MELKEFKEKVKSKSVDIIAYLGVFTLSEIMDIEDVREAKKNFDELSDLINEYINEYEKHKFKVGDYVVDVSVNYIAEIKSIFNEKVIGGTPYRLDYSEFSDLNFGCHHKVIRHATQGEIAEYEAALQFHEHGRKPFEVKEGDVIKVNNRYKCFASATDFWIKKKFISGNYTFLKTAEEVEAWLSDGKTDIG